MTKFKYNRLLIICIIIGLIAAVVVNIQRYNVEQANKTVDLAIDYEDMLKLAQMEGLPTEEVLSRAKEAGITSLAVYETTFEKLNKNGKTIAIPGSQLLESYYSGTMSSPYWRGLVADGTIKGDESYVVGHDLQTYLEVKEDLFRRLGDDRVTVLHAGSQEFLAVKANHEELLKMNLGMPTDEMQAVNNAGFYVLARPSNYKNVTDDDIDAVFKRLDGINVSEIVFSGSETLGGLHHTERTIEQMKERGLTLGAIEHVTQLQFYPQDGLFDIIRGLDYKVARLYAIPKDEQPKLKMDTAVERWANTDQERNIRINLMRIYEKPVDDMSLLDTNMQYISMTKDKLVEKGFTIDKASSFEPFFGNRILQILMLLGVCAAGVMYISLIFPTLSDRRLYALLGVCFIACLVCMILGKGSLIRVAGALAAANIFPVLGMISQLDVIRRNRLVGKLKFTSLLFKSVKAIICASLISFMGAMYLSGILADVEFFLEMNIFRGIKLTFVLPLILVALAFMKRFDIFGEKLLNPPNLKVQLKRILNMNVSVKVLAGFLVALVAAVIFIGRSGHTAGVPVPGIELKLRAFLEQAFYARPRSKELFIGHPAFILMMMAWYRKWPSAVFFILSIIATIGQGSMVETFAHMRTPVFMSLMRGIDGVIWGCVLGCVIMGTLYLWQYVTSSTDRSNSLNE
ncbi:DUF5693 family protein [Megamonas hypermegale]|uniref:DUF5693 family protein n=1 Tax=Megamonas hypermegale TaxID=158847 RepID=UPI0026F18F9D|nr:DUF5693 family protein [Megamonas hypermegale]